MQLPQIRMESKLAQISMRTIDAKQEIRQPKAEVSIEQPKAEFKIEKKPGKLSIDQTEAFADMNLMSILQRNNRFAKEGMEAIQEGTARRAAEGTELMQIEKGGNPLVSQAVQMANPPQKTLGIKFIPSVGSVKVQYEPAEISIQFTPQKPIIQTKVNAPEYNYTPGKVEIDVDQKQALHIDFVNLYPEREGNKS